MKKRNKIQKMIRVAIMLFFLLYAGHLIAQNECDFYTETIQKYPQAKNLKNDYGIDGLGNKTDSEKLQKAIDEASAVGGGRIFMPQGKYLLGGIKMKSNVHLEIENGTQITLIETDNKGAIGLFSFGGGGQFVENASIRGVGGKFIINNPAYEPGVWSFSFGRVQNFMISDFHINDQKTKFSCVGMGISTSDKKTWYTPMNGVVKNGSVSNTDYGYGLVQTQAAKHVLFKNLDGEGGVTLRFETGYSLMNKLQIGGIFDLYGRNISCSNGNAAVMISPHAMQNGNVDVDGVKSVNCGFGVRIEGGYNAPKNDTETLKPGTFEKVVVKNVESTFGTTAQLKTKHYDWIPVYREKFITKQSCGNKSFVGPSIAAVLWSAKSYDQNVKVTNVKAHGFLCQKPILREQDKHSTLDCDTTVNNGTMFDPGSMK